MLLRYRDALYEQKPGIASADSHDSRRLQLPRDFNNAMRELDRCLSKMRNQGNQQAIHGVPLKTIRFHVIAWYIDVDYVQTPIYTHRANRKGWVRTLTGYKLEPRRHREAREPKAQLGVEWIANEYHWSDIHLKAIIEACGELAQAA